MAGTYTSPKRVERDGRLVAFEGEEMTMDEAVVRGLVSQPKKSGRPTKAELLEKAGETMTNPELAEAVAKAEESPAKPRRRTAKKAEE